MAEAARAHLSLRFWRAVLATLFLLCFIAWVPGFFTLPPLDRDESRFAQATKQMIETGNYVDIRYSIGPRYKKPVGIYWLQATSTQLFGNRPTTKSGPIACRRCWADLRRCFSPSGARAPCFATSGLLAAALIGLTVSLTAEAKIAKTDAVQLATTPGAQALLMRAYLPRATHPRAAQPWVALAGWAASDSAY